MASRVVTETLCDICLREFGTEREATFSEAVAIGGSRRTLELCFDHEQEIVGPLRLAMDRFGGPVSSRAEQLLDAGKCPVCQKPYANRKALVRHVEDKHERPLGTVLSA